MLAVTVNLGPCLARNENVLTNLETTGSLRKRPGSPTSHAPQGTVRLTGRSGKVGLLTLQIRTLGQARVLSNSPRMQSAGAAQMELQDGYF